MLALRPLTSDPVDCPSAMHPDSASASSGITAPRHRNASAGPAHRWPAALRIHTSRPTRHCFGALIARGVVGRAFGSRNRR
jgi:hypothetical protein